MKIIPKYQQGKLIVKNDAISTYRSPILSPIERTDESGKKWGSMSNKERAALNTRQGRNQFTSKPIARGNLEISSPEFDVIAGVRGIPFDKLLGKAGEVVERGLAKSGNNWARARQINRSFKPAIDRFDGTVGKEYFKSPDKWYRVTETPEVHGIEEVGRNVTTRDAADIIVPSDKWRRSIIDNNLIPVKDGGWSVKKSKFIFSKRGQAHGNTSQAAKGQIWGGTFAQSNKFPNAILEGNLKNKVHRGFDPATGTDSRTNFVLQDWESIPNGARIGFHTGEMPMDGLKAFTELPSGRFRMEPVIPNKTISVKSNNVPVATAPPALIPRKQ